jgi:hypothetical protein
MRVYNNLDNEIQALGLAGAPLVLPTRLRQAIAAATGLDLPIVGVGLEPGLYHISFYADFNPQDWADLTQWREAVKRHAKGGPVPGPRPVANHAPGGTPRRVYLEKPSGLRLILRVSAAIHGQSAAHAEAAERQFRIAKRDRFRRTARARPFDWRSIFTQKFRDDHLGFDTRSASMKVGQRAGATARFNHVMLLDPSSEASWNSLIDLVGSMNLQMMFSPGVDYKMPRKFRVFEYDHVESRITRDISAYVWFQVRSDDGVMKIHHLSGIEDADGGYVGQARNAGRVTEHIQSMRNLDVTNPTLA